MIRQWVPPLIVPKVLITNINFHEQLQDEAIWKLSDNRLFSCSTSSEHIRRRRDKNIISKGIFHKYIPFKISFLVWRSLRGKLPTNEKIIRFGMDTAKCSCIYRPSEEDIEHIFICGHFANNVWSFVCCSCRDPP